MDNIPGADALLKPILLTFISIYAYFVYLNPNEKQTWRFWTEYLFGYPDYIFYIGYILLILFCHDFWSRFPRLNFISAALALLAGLYFQLQVYREYGFNMDYMASDIDRQYLISPYFIVDYFGYICTMILLFFDQCYSEPNPEAPGRRRKEWSMVFLLVAINIFVGPDVAFAIFSLRYRYQNLVPTQYAPWKLGVLISVLTLFFVVRVIHGIIDPPASVIALGSLSAIGIRTVWGVIFSGFNVFTYSAPSIRVIINEHGERQSDFFFSHITTTAVHFLFFSFLTHAVLPFPVFLSMGVGKQGAWTLPQHVNRTRVFTSLAAFLLILFYCNGGIVIGVAAVVVAYYLLDKRFDMLEVLIAFNLIVTVISTPANRIIVVFVLGLGIAVSLCAHGFRPFAGVIEFYKFFVQCLPGLQLVHEGYILVLRGVRAVFQEIVSLVRIPLDRIIFSAIRGIIGFIGLVVQFQWAFIRRVLRGLMRSIGYGDHDLEVVEIFFAHFDWYDFMMKVVSFCFFYQSITKTHWPSYVSLISANVLMYDASRFVASSVNDNAPLLRRTYAFLRKVAMILSVGYVVLFAANQVFTEQTHIPNIAGCSDILPPVPSPELLGTEMLKAIENNFLAYEPQDRGQHNNSYFCGHGTFTTLDSTNFPDRFKHGMFRSSRQIDAQIRISSAGAAGNYSIPSSGVKGLAIKLPGIVDDPVLDIDEVFRFRTPSDQDFLFINSKTFFISDDALEHYTILSSFANDYWAVLPWLFEGFQISFFELIRRVKPLINVAKLAKMPPDVPLRTEYTSATPYGVIGGDAHVEYVAVKYELRPCQDPEYEVCFDFYIRENSDLCSEPIGDSTIPWEGFVLKVANLRGHIDVGNNFCDTLSFNPWHTSKAHVPLGKVNLKRLSIYAAAEYRRLAQRYELYDEGSISSGLDPGGDVDGHPYASYAGYPRLPRYADGYDISSLYNLNRDGGFKDVAFLFVALKQYAVITNRIKKHKWPSDTTLKSYKSYKDVFKRNDNDFPVPQILDLGPDAWREDRTFTQQFLSGINPGQLSLASRYRWPANVSDHDLMLAGLNIEYMIQQETLIFAEYSILEGINVAASSVVYPGVVFFELTPVELIPRAIQLTRFPEGNVIYTPSSPAESWLFAKMHILQSDAMVHEFISHLLNTHLASEPIAVGIRRVLPVSHPFRGFMEPHYSQLLSINQFGRNTLLNDGGAFEIGSAIGTRGTMQLMQKAYMQYNFSVCHNFVRYMERGGLNIDLALKIPRHYYAEDGLRLWNVNSEYAKKTVELLWPTDADVSMDKGLQRLYWQLTSAVYADIVGLPDFRKSQIALVDFLSSLLYMNTQQHGAFNNEQYEGMGFQPARPFRLSKPMPQNAEDVDDNYIISSLPTGDQTSEIIKITRILSSQTFTPLLTDRQFKGYSQFLGCLQYNQSESFSKIWKQYQDELMELERSIKIRNSGLPGKPFRYDAILPSRVARSIDV